MICENHKTEEQELRIGAVQVLVSEWVRDISLGNSSHDILITIVVSMEVLWELGHNSL